MKFSWNWLSDYVDLAGIDPGAVADRFTLTVAELEGVEETGCGLKDVLVGRVAAVEPHPDADKLVVVEMDLGDRRVRGVSGAPNIRVGLVTPVALPGCRLPGGMEIKATDVRGVTSEVVVLSERETGLSDDHSGVIELPADTRLGESFPHVLPLEDVVFDVDNKSITHRPDLWGHHGVAREVAAMLRLPLKPLETEFPTIDADPLQVIVDDAADCPRYMAMCYSGVKVAPSPFWMGQRLRAVGMRPISNVVDVSNFVMLATGEPTHAFDMRQLNGDTIRVRRAGEGEPFRTLDGLDHELTGDDLLIADAERGGALAGVMGGENSEISDDTSDVVLECATFHVLTPYPGTPLFAQLEAEGRILTRDWSYYDTAHVVFRPARMTAAQLLDGYERAYRRLYSWRSVLARRPRGSGVASSAARAAAHVAMTVLYKKQDWLWRALVPLRLTHAAWQPLIALHQQMAALRHARVRCGTLGTRMAPARGLEHAAAPTLEDEQPGHQTLAA